MDLCQWVKHDLDFGQRLISAIFQDVTSTHVITTLLRVNIHLGANVNNAWTWLEFVLPEALLIFYLVQFSAFFRDVSVQNIGVVINPGTGGDESR